MDVSPSLFLILAALIGGSAFFSMLETSFSTVNAIRLKNRAEDGDTAAAAAVKILDMYDRALSTILIGNNIVNIASASISTVIFTAIFGASGALVSTVVATLTVLTFGEILPKTYAKQRSEALCLKYARVLAVVITILGPLSAFFMLMQKTMTKYLSESEKTPSVTEEELKYIIDTIEDEGVLEEEEADLVQSALRFSDTTVQEILTPRVDVVGVDIDDPIEETLELIMKERYTRLPVFEKSIDRIVGILHSRDLLEAVINKQEIDLRAMLTEPYFIHKGKTLSTLLADFQRDRVHIAVVADGYGGTVGIVTMEDLLEELVGEIWDEDDEVREDLVRIGPDTYQVSGDMDVEDLFEEIGFEDRSFESEYYSLSGWALDRFEHMPEVGESFNYKGIDIMVAELDDRRITKLLITAPVSEKDDSAED